MPSDHLRLLIELLRPASPELARRWLAALMIVPPQERQSVVAAVEARIVEEFGQGAPGVFTAIAPAVQRDGYVEQIETEYEVRAPRREAPGAASPKRRRRTGR